MHYTVHKHCRCHYVTLHQSDAAFRWRAIDALPTRAVN